MAVFFNTAIPASSYNDLEPVAEFYYRNLQHPMPCNGNLIPVPKFNGTSVCIMPIILEAILLGHDDPIDESIYETIIKKYEKYSCSKDTHVLLFKWYHKENNLRDTDRSGKTNRWWRMDGRLYVIR